MILKREKIIKILYALSLLSFSFISCEAPRNNPLDPLSPFSSEIIIDGKVQTFSLPRTVLPEVSVFWSPADKYTMTDVNGLFLFEDIEPIDGLLIFRKEGFKNDTMFIGWNGAKKIDVEISLNQIPILETISIQSVVINQTSSVQSSELVVEAKIIDNDNDIDTVYLRNENLSLNRALGFNAADKIYETILKRSELNIADIEETIGLNFNIFVLDNFGAEYYTGNDNVTRIIKDGANILFPANNMIVDSLPLLTWENFQAGFSFTYSIEIFTNDLANPQLVFTVENILPETTTYQINNPLPAGEYYWVIWVKDNLMNRVRSSPAIFVVR